MVQGGYPGSGVGTGPLLLISENVTNSSEPPKVARMKSKVPTEDPGYRDPGTVLPKRALARALLRARQRPGSTSPRLQGPPASFSWRQRRSVPHAGVSPTGIFCGGGSRTGILVRGLVSGINPGALSRPRGRS